LIGQFGYRKPPIFTFLFMKQLLTLVALSMTMLSLQAQTYVNIAAAPGGNGSSWGAAFNSLDAALTAAGSGDEIWVATGIYSPASEQFSISESITLRGGFVGNETTASQADPLNNPTELNGDIAGDDLPGDPLANRTDNRRIMSIDVASGNGVVIDGFIFRSGQTDFDPDATGEILPFAGSAILAITTVSVQNCVFIENAAEYGAVAILDPPASGSSVSGSDFVGNISNGRGEAIYLNNAFNLAVNDCSFTNNSGPRGSLYAVSVLGLAIEDCSFVQNIATEGRGGALGLFECSATTVTNCVFTENRVVTAAAPDPDALGFSRGGAVYVTDDTELDIDPSRVVFTDCTFTANETDGIIGGAVYSLRADNTWVGCTFTDNVAGSFGGALFGFAAEGNRRKMIIDDCLFEGHVVASTGLGASLAVINKFDLDVTNTTFQDNGTLFGSGSGAAFGTFGSFDTLDLPTSPMVYNFDNVNFVSNFATDIGGALYLQSPIGVIELNISNSDFINNVCDECEGGAIYSFNSVEINLDNVQASFNFGFDGGFAFFRGGEDNPEFGNEDRALNISKSIFDQNISDTQGGAIDVQLGGDLNIVNSLFFANVCRPGGNGSGGAIIANGDEIGQQVNLANNTFVLNRSDFLGDDVAVFTADDVSPPNVTVLSLVNNAFASDFGGGNASIEIGASAGNPIIQSAGGNYFVQEITDFVPNPADIIDTESDPAELFMNVDLDEPDFTLNLNYDGGNPLVNGGVDFPDVPTDDLNGAQRFGLPDIGAYEGASITSLEETTSGALRLSFYPNPVKSSLVINFQEMLTANPQVRLTDLQGRTLASWSGEAARDQLNVSKLPAGTYVLEVTVDNRRYVGKLIKD
jgi:hypothetical protein